MSYQNKKITEAIKRSGKKKGIICKEAKISRDKLWRIENGKHTPDIEELEIIADTTGVPLSFFLEDATLQSSSQHSSPSPNIVSAAEPIHEVPLISWVVANQFGEAVDIFQPGQADEWVTTTHKGKDCFALRVKGDCMTPIFLENDRIIIDPNMNPEHNDYIIARDSASNEATFKQYKKYGEKIVLHPLNTHYDDILVDSSRYEIVGVVVDLNRKIK